MGPRPIGRGNTAANATVSSTLALQWGRDQLVAEISCGSAAAAVPDVASMGPRPIGRGNFTPGLALLGKLLVLQWGRDQLVAEMTSSRRQGAKPALLQWGRDQLVAEICATRARAYSSTWLQWGRDQLVAEIQDLVQLVQLGFREASMGPRPIGRGNILKPVITS